MPIRNQIEAVVNQMVINPAFLYGTRKELNKMLDDTLFPAVLLFNLPQSELSTTLSQAVNEKYALFMQFLFKTEFDENTAQNETIIIQAAAMRDEFLVKIGYYRESPDQSRYFKIHKNEKMKSIAIYNKNDVNSTGVTLSLTLGTMNNTRYDPDSRPA